MEINQKYPVLKDHIVAIKIKKPKESKIIVYDSITGRKKQINQKVFTFLKQAIGSLTFKEISKKLYKKQSSKKALSELEKLIDPLILKGIITLRDTPLRSPRAPSPSVTAVHHLQNVYVELTRECNLSCKHCYAGAGTPRDDELTFQEITSLIDQMAEIGVLSIVLTGGEPLLYPHIFEIMKYARKKRLSVLLFTNGTLIVPYIAQKLQLLPVFKVAVSVDGPDALTHDGIRGVDGAFQKTLRGIILLKNFEIPTQVNICLSRSNYDKFEEILFLMKHLGVTEFYVRPVTFTGRNSSDKKDQSDKTEEDFSITPVEYLEALRLLHNFKVRELNMNPQKRVAYSPQEINCGIGTQSLTVQSDGTVVPCPLFAQDASLGSIRTQSLLEIWNDSSLLNTLRTMNIFETHPCKDCQFVGMCKGGCIGDVYRRSHRFSCYDPFTCASFQALRNYIVYRKVKRVPPEDRLSIYFV
jgi:radical SAM protein with 4Fe4S-binding SPASM domain